MRKLLLLVGQRAPSVALGWEQTVLSQREGQRETMMDSCLLPHTLQGQEGTKLSTFLLSCLPQEPDQLRRRGLEGFTEDHCQCIAQMAFLTPYLIVGCWGRNRQQPYPTAPEAKILMEASSSGLPRVTFPPQSAPLQQPIPTGTGRADGVCALAGFHSSPCPGASTAAEGLW